MEFNKHLGNMRKKSIPELQELLERQEKILANTSMVKKLKDKGAKATHLRDEIKKIIDESHSELETVTKMMDKISISPHNKEINVNEDIEEQRVHEMFANNETTKTLKKDDLFYSKLSETIDLMPKDIKRERFNRPKTMNVKHVVTKTTPKFDEESAVVFPIGPHPESKLLSFDESLHLQPEYLMRVKEKRRIFLTKTGPNDDAEFHPDAISGSAYREVPEVDLDID